LGGSVSSPTDDYLLTLEWASSGTCLKSGFKNSDLFATVDTTDIVAKCTETPEGYSIEAAIPLEALTLSAGDVFGFDLRINDDDDGGSRDTQIAWFVSDAMGWGTGWNMPSLIAQMELVNETLGVTSNFDFEQPGTEKIKGWDGACSDVSYTGSNADIPGWSSDTPAFDSGVEQNGGSWVAFLMAFDPSMFHVTELTVGANDVVTLSVDARNSWSESGEQKFKMSLYVDNAGTRETIVSREIVLPDEMARYDLSFNAADHPAAVGRKIGIEFDNINATARSWYYLDNVELAITGTTAVAEEKLMGPEVFSLSQNYPNPFNPSTTIDYSLRKAGKVRLAVYDLTGREVAVLADGVRPQGIHQVTFSGEDLGNGVFFYKLVTQDEVITKKMTLIK
jgi:hypothetical protein